MKKIERGTLQSCPVSQMHEKILAETETRTRDRWVPPKSTEVCTKKWVHIQGELCGLTEKN